jgi:hypothetical protein
MDSNIEQLLSEYDARSAEEWRSAEELGAKAFESRDEMLLSVSRSPGQDAAAYRRRVRDSGRFDTVLLPVGSGIELSRLRS